MGPDKFDVTDQQRRDVYETVFNRFAFGKPSLSLPRLILVGAQPGAGKSRVAIRARKELKKLGMPVMADIDDIRPDYPDVEAVFKEFPFKMSAVTNKECWGWTSHLLLDARHAKNNVVYQATIRHANRIGDLIKDFQKEGFAVDLFTVAANAKHSVYGIFRRFEDDIEKMMDGSERVPRWVPIPFHNQVYKVFPQNVDYLAENARLERVGVFSRDGKDLYFSEDRLIHRGAGDALVKEQQRLWSPEERGDHNNAWKVLLERIETRAAGILKPKWYVRTARLYAVEAEYFALAQELCAGSPPSGLVVVHRTPNHHFVKTDGGLLVSYENARNHAVGSAKHFAPKPATRDPK